MRFLGAAMLVLLTTPVSAETINITDTDLNSMPTWGTVKVSDPTGLEADIGEKFIGEEFFGKVSTDCTIVFYPTDGDYPDSGYPDGYPDSGYPDGYGGE